MYTHVLDSDYTLSLSGRKTSPIAFRKWLEWVELNVTNGIPIFAGKNVLIVGDDPVFFSLTSSKTKSARPYPLHEEVSGEEVCGEPCHDPVRDRTWS